MKRRDSRRGTQFAAVALVAAGSMLFAGCASGADAGEGSGSGSVVFATFGGVLEESERTAWLDPFAEETGIEVTTDGPVDYGKIKSMVESGNVTWDVVEVGGDFGMSSSEELLEPLDCSIITCDGAVDGLTNTDYRAAIYTTGIVMAWNSDVLSGTPASWQDFFDTETFPGKRTISSNPSTGILEGALIADGVAVDDLYPLDLDRAFAKLDTIKDDIIWWETPTQSQELLQSGEAVMGGLWVPRVHDLGTRLGVDVGIAWETLAVSADYVVIPKGAPNLDAAQQLVAYITDPANNGRLSEVYPLGSAVNGATVSEENKDWLVSSHIDEGVILDDNYYDEFRDEVVDRFGTWQQNG